MTFYELLDLFTFVSPIVLFVGVVTGVYCYRSLDLSHKVIMYYLLIALSTDIISRIYGHVYGNNLIFILIFALLELGVFSILYYNLLKKNKKVFLIGIGIAVLFMLWEIWSLKMLHVADFQSYSKVVDTFLIVCFSIAYFFEKINSQTQTEWDLFLLNSVILGFFSLNLIFFLPINYLINETSILKFYFWFANLILTLLFYVFLTRAIWKNGRTHKQLHRGL
ncbi:hypothetical protein [Flavobacterium kingsejongi]|uniref:Uncharacterized protein n=1 Tax=Flavobacterium kingsejongi TaxID=1678728 RepID=A0A2S1LKS8_9FLAO|nr:hypothetical protein [Flavobacterium kingsejongi]AWG24380.1 hypothetical protein FK004_03605 [Flavobacterium kingsejongi]